MKKETRKSNPPNKNNNRTGANQGGSQAKPQKPNRPAPVEAIPVFVPNIEGPVPDCPICHKPIDDIITALASAEHDGQPCHFECVLARMNEQEKLESNEKIVYLGAGKFAVIEIDEKKQGAFIVKRRIAWESDLEKKPWRKGISTKLINL